MIQEMTYCQYIYGYFDLLVNQIDIETEKRIERIEHESDEKSISITQYKIKHLNDRRESSIESLNHIRTKIISLIKYNLGAETLNEKLISSECETINKRIFSDVFCFVVKNILNDSRRRNFEYFIVLTNFYLSPYEINLIE